MSRTDARARKTGRRIRASTAPVFAGGNTTRMVQTLTSYMNMKSVKLRIIQAQAQTQRVSQGVAPRSAVKRSLDLPSASSAKTSPCTHHDHSVCALPPKQKLPYAFSCYARLSCYRRTALVGYELQALLSISAYFVRPPTRGTARIVRPATENDMNSNDDGGMQNAPPPRFSDDRH